MAEDAETKAKRRRHIRESLPPPLNEIALRHVDSVQSLSEDQRRILVNVLQKKGLRYLVDCIAILKSPARMVTSENELIEFLQGSANVQSLFRIAASENLDSDVEDKKHLANLLIQCYPDMPLSSADALVSSEVMCACLQVIVATRRALVDAKSDFVVTVLYALFENRLRTISQIINENPSFIKAIHRSHPDWKTNC